MPAVTAAARPHGTVAGGLGAAPARRRDNRERHRETEERLREARVRDRDRRREQEEDGQAAEHALRDDGGERQIRQAAHPGPPLAAGERDGDDDRQKPDGRGDQPMRVLELDAADPLRDRERERVLPVSRGPVGHGETRFGRRDEAARENQPDRGQSEGQSQPVQRALSGHALPRAARRSAARFAASSRRRDRARCTRMARDRRRAPSP